jgi:hypothetical protein
MWTESHYALTLQKPLQLHTCVALHPCIVLAIQQSAHTCVHFHTGACDGRTPDVLVRCARVSSRTTQRGQLVVVDVIYSALQEIKKIDWTLADIIWLGISIILSQLSVRETHQLILDPLRKLANQFFNARRGISRAVHPSTNYYEIQQILTQPKKLQLRNSIIAYLNSTRPLFLLTHKL